jgi:hypothetical protein
MSKMNLLMKYYAVVILICLPLQNAYADDLNPDEWEWELFEVLHGHTHQASVDAENTGFLTVEPNGRPSRAS